MKALEVETTPKDCELKRISHMWHIWAMWMRSSKGRGQGKSQKGFFNNGSKYTTIASDNNGQVKNKHWYMYATIEY